MSDPNIPKRTQEEALTDLLESIALEETALAHILNAEGEKIQAIVENIPFNSANTETIIKLQDSIRKTLRLPIKKEMLLQFKLEDVLKTKTKIETTTSTTTTSSTTQSTTTQSTTTQSTTTQSTTTQSTTTQSTTTQSTTTQSTTTQSTTTQSTTTQSTTTQSTTTQSTTTQSTTTQSTTTQSTTTQSTTTQSTTTISTTSTGSTTTAPTAQCCVKGSGGGLDGDDPWNKIAFEIGTDEDPLCNCGGTISGTLGYYQARDNDTPPVEQQIIYLEITDITSMTCNNGSVTITGLGDEYDDDPNNGGTLVAEDRSFDLILEEGNPDQLQMTITRTPDTNYVSGVVEVTNGQINITDCPT